MSDASTATSSAVWPSRDSKATRRCASVVATAVPRKNGPTATIAVRMAIAAATPITRVRVPSATSVAPSLAPLARVKASVAASRRIPESVIRVASHLFASLIIVQPGVARA